MKASSGVSQTVLRTVRNCEFREESFLLQSRNKMNGVESLDGTQIKTIDIDDYNTDVYRKYSEDDGDNSINEFGFNFDVDNYEEERFDSDEKVTNLVAAISALNELEANTEKGVNINGERDRILSSLGFNLEKDRKERLGKISALFHPTSIADSSRADKGFQSPFIDIQKMLVEVSESDSDDDDETNNEELNTPSLLQEPEEGFPNISAAITDLNDN